MLPLSSTAWTVKLSRRGVGRTVSGEPLTALGYRSRRIFNFLTICAYQAVKKLTGTLQDVR